MNFKRTFKNLGIAAAILPLTVVTAGCDPVTMERTPTATMVASTMGLLAGIEYPLVVGDKITGTYGTTNLNVRSGLFSTVVDFQANSQPASAVTVVFIKSDEQSGKRQWNLELPTALIEYRIVSNDTPETVLINMNQYKYYSGGGTADCTTDNWGNPYPKGSLPIESCKITSIPLGATLGVAVHDSIINAVLTVHQDTADHLSGATSH